jgi:hypothetical protein
MVQVYIEMYMYVNARATSVAVSDVTAGVRAVVAHLSGQG